MAKATAKKAPTAEEVVAQNGGIDNAVATATEKEAVAPTAEEVVVEETATATTADTTAEETDKGSEEDTEDQEAAASATVNAPETVKAPKAEKPAEEVVSVPEKIVETLGLKDHTCRIGGTIITVEKDKVQKFTASVALILQHARVVVVK